MQDQPPADAFPLADAFERYTDPQLLEALRQAEERVRAAEAAVPPQPNFFERGWGGRFEEALEAWRQLPTVRAAGKVRKEAADAMRAVDDERHGRLASGEWLAWGREGSPVGPWRLLPADAWRYFRFRRGDVVEVPGPPPIRFYGVRVAPAKREGAVATAPKSARRRNAQHDALLKIRIKAVVAAARLLWPNKDERPPVTQMAMELHRRNKAEGYSSETLRRILHGTYAPAERLGIDLSAW